MIIFFNVIEIFTELIRSDVCTVFKMYLSPVQDQVEQSITTVLNFQNPHVVIGIPTEFLLLPRPPLLTSPI